MSELAQKIDRYAHYLEADPHNATLWVAYGDVLHRAGQLERAETAYRSGLALDPQSAVVNSRLAAVEITRHNFASAEQILHKLIDAGERDPALHFNFALALYYQRRFSEALNQFEALTDVAAVAMDARYFVLSCLHNLLREEEALARGQAFLAQSPSPKLQGYLALILLDAQRAPEAYELARCALREQPDNTDAAAVLATHALEEQQIEDADRLLQVVVSREPNNVRALQGLALAALHRGEHAAAVEHLQRAIATDAENLASYITLGWVHITRHDYVGAERAFRDGIAVDRNEAELHGGLATALLFQRELEEAKREIHLALGLNAACFGALFARSVLLCLEGKEALATDLLARMLRRSLRSGAPTPVDSLVKYWKRQSFTPSSTGAASDEH